MIMSLKKKLGIFIFIVSFIMLISSVSAFLDYSINQEYSILHRFIWSLQEMGYLLMGVSSTILVYEIPSIKEYIKNIVF